MYLQQDNKPKGRKTETDRRFIIYQNMSSREAHVSSILEPLFALAAWKWNPFPVQLTICNLGNLIAEPSLND